LKEIIQSDLGITELNLDGSKGVTDAGGAQIAKLESLQSLNLSATNISDETLKAISSLKQLRRLDLRDTRVSDEGLSYLTKLNGAEYAGLDYLGLAQTRITNKGVKHLTKLTRLETLVLNYIPAINGDSLRMLKDLNLKRLNLRGVSLEDGLQAVSKMRKVMRLDLGEAMLNDQNIQDLKDMTELRSLNIQGTGVTTKGFECLAGLVHLQNLNASNLEITDSALPFILNLPIFVLDLSATRISDRGVVLIAKMKHLTDLNLSSTAASDQGLAAIATLPFLKNLDLSGTNVTDKGLPVIAKTQLEKAYFIGCNQISRRAAYDLDNKINKMDEQNQDALRTNAKGDYRRKMDIRFTRTTETQSQ